MVRTIKGALKEIQLLDPNSDITEYTIRQIVKQGKIPYIRSGNKYLINVELLLDYINGNSAVEKEENS